MFIVLLIIFFIFNNLVFFYILFIIYCICMKLGRNIKKFFSWFNGDIKRVFILNDINGIYNV